MPLSADCGPVSRHYGATREAVKRSESQSRPPLAGGECSPGPPPCDAGRPPVDRRGHRTAVVSSSPSTPPTPHAGAPRTGPACSGRLHPRLPHPVLPWSSAGVDLASGHGDGGGCDPPSPADGAGTAINSTVQTVPASDAGLTGVHPGNPGVPTPRGHPGQPQQRRKTQRADGHLPGDQVAHDCSEPPVDTGQYSLSLSVA